MPLNLQDLERRMAEVSRAPENGRNVDQEVGFLACQEALGAARQGNYGVGAVLVDPSGEVVVRERNRAFFPRFRSDFHAEMLAMNEFEDRNPRSRGMRGYRMVTSLEPCPMCCARLLIAGVERVRYVAVDEWGGMTTRTEHLPPAFRKLSRPDQFGPADVSDELRQLAADLFQLNLQALREKLWER